MKMTADTPWHFYAHRADDYWIAFAAKGLDSDEDPDIIAFRLATSKRVALRAVQRSVLS